MPGGSIALGLLGHDYVDVGHFFPKLTFEEPWDDLIGESVRVFDDEGIARRGPRRVPIFTRVDHLVRLAEEDGLVLYLLPSPRLRSHRVRSVCWHIS